MKASHHLKKRLVASQPPFPPFLTPSSPSDAVLSTGFGYQKAVVLAGEKYTSAVEITYSMHALGIETVASPSLVG